MCLYLPWRACLSFCWNTLFCYSNRHGAVGVYSYSGMSGHSVYITGECTNTHDRDTSAHKFSVQLRPKCVSRPENDAFWYHLGLYGFILTRVLVIPLSHIDSSIDDFSVSHWLEYWWFHWLIFTQVLMISLSHIDSSNDDFIVTYLRKY